MHQSYTKGPFSYLTLELSCPNMKQKFDHRRSKIFQSLFVPFIILVSCMFANLIFIFRNNFEEIRTLLFTRISVLLVFVIAWQVSKRWFLLSPLVLFFPIVLDGLVLNLTILGLVDIVSKETVLLLEYQQFCSIVIWTIFNFNSFRITVISFPLLFLVPYYFQVVKFATIRDEIEQGFNKTFYIERNLSSYLLYVIISLTTQYLKMREICLFVVDNFRRKIYKG